ncbi:hypothetical protein [Leifsonia shinshuensis]|uniref:Helicase n=1 Tax=Leifsonia shinshuensis TaxID=150026 RepID=A0A7G6Y759_9MICO|nr:hypothetical protein [Leifsonia shinshuensis]QNE34324.1 hypothetical protein F1C12_03670 [Leifsonia shinshuensis]
MDGADGDENILRLTVGGSTRAQLRAALESHGVLLNAHASTLLDHEAFDRRDPVEVSVVERDLRELGLGDGGTLPEVFAAAGEHGLSLCPPDTGPYLRLALRSQPNAPDSILSAGRSPAGAIKAAAAPLSDDVEFPKGFYLRVVDHVPWLRGYRCDDEYRFSAGDRFAFTLPS